MRAVVIAIDYNAPDWEGTSHSNVPLSDFFGLATARSFAHIDTGSYPYTCFMTVGSCWTESGTYAPEDPDED